MNTIVYSIGNNLYINLTNQCTNRCVFCVRNGKESYEGYPLWLDREPTASETEEAIGDPSRYEEIVFCGFGEPTCRLDVMLEVCGYVHAHGGKTRLNTNGHGNLLAGRDITGELKGKLDGINISLNAPTEEEYLAQCHPLVEDAYAAVLAFGRACKRAGLNAWFSVVDHIGAEKIALCRKIAEEVGIPLRVRAYIG